MPPAHADRCDGCAENKVKGPCQASESGQHDHFDRYPTDKRQAHRDCRQRRQRLSAECDRSCHQRGDADKAKKDDSRD